MNERGIVSKAEHKKKEKMDLFRQEEKAHINVWETKALDSVFKTLYFSHFPNRTYLRNVNAV